MRSLSKQNYCCLYWKFCSSRVFILYKILLFFVISIGELELLLICRLEKKKSYKFCLKLFTFIKCTI